MDYTYRMTIEKLDANGRSVEAHSASATPYQNDDGNEDDCLAYICSRALSAMCPPHTNPPDLNDTVFQMLFLLGWELREEAALNAIVRARLDWSGVYDFGRCVSVTINQLMLKAGESEDDDGDEDEDEKDASAPDSAIR